MYPADVTEEAYPIHFAIARELGGEVKPFDVYQGPYVVIGGDIRCGDGPYAGAPRGLGIVRLWLCSDDGEFGFVYNEANEQSSQEFIMDDLFAAVEAAKEVLT